MRASVAACAAVVLLLAAACAADTMRGYVGQDIRAVMLAYGPPAGEIDLGGGARAFQWSKTSVDTTPPTEVTTTERDRKGRRVTRTEFVGGSQTVTDCVYTFLTARDPRRDGWIVTGFRQPSLDCAIGGLGW
jgi:predicted small secreted protein